MKRKKAKKLDLCFHLSMRKQSETDPVSLRFASKRKKILCETGAPYAQSSEPPVVRNRTMCTELRVLVKA
jgi:hypothetical protein